MGCQEDEEPDPRFYRPGWTLLDPRTYSFDPARPALRKLRESGVSLIICTSKTRAEVQEIRAALGNSDPFIVENGGAIFVPEGYFPIELPESRRDSGFLVIEMGTSYSRILSVFSRMKVPLAGRLRGFSDLSVEEVARLTGLSDEEAARAKKRNTTSRSCWMTQPRTWTSSRAWPNRQDSASPGAVSFI